MGRNFGLAQENNRGAPAAELRMIQSEGNNLGMLSKNRVNDAL